MDRSRHQSHLRILITKINDMKIFTHDEIMERFNKLPQALRDAMFADVNTDLMLELGKSHGLMLDRVGQLADETAYIILGLVHPKDFVERLTERLKIPQEKAVPLASDINAKVFDPIRAHLMQVHDFPASALPQAAKEPDPPQTEPAPAFRQPSFAMPVENLAAKAPMIFPQKMAAPPPIPKSVVPQRANDPYREKIE